MEYNIYAYKCKRCGHVQYPYRTVCGNCRENNHNEFDIVPLSKNGKLVTFTNLYTLPADFETVTLALGIVELDDGNRVTGQLKIAEPKMGMKVSGKVEIVRKDEYGKNLGLVFYEG
jgi:hypothetical protein